MKKQRQTVYKSGHENYNDLDTMRHSCAHIMAAAVKELWPDTKFGIGPTTEDGFYYDFDFSEKVSDEDLPKIESKMHELVKNNLQFVKSETNILTAYDLAVNEGQPYKAQLIDGLKSTESSVSIYTSGTFSDLCKGPHVENASQIGPFKLLSVAGAYWKGSEKNKMLTRIYGTCFATQDELDNYIKREEEAKLRDHRKLGKDLDLFVFSDLVGKGLPMLTPKGAAIRRSLERFIVDEEIKRGYSHVYSPPLAKVDLYKTSGHYPYYKDTMYPVMKVDDEELILRPMTCPHHFMMFKSKPRSYRDMPVRFAEISPQFRYEKSGELTGLLRVRMFMLADAHIITQKEHAKEEIIAVLNLIDFVNKTLGLAKGTDYRYRLSLGDRNDSKKYYKDDASWEYAENVLRGVLVDMNAPFYEAKNEAAFYGPKIDVQMKNVNGKEDTAFTVQYDFVMPKRFDLRFINQQGKEEEPIVVHRASLGCLERTMAFLIEKFNGAFPTWLSPVQVKVLPIADRHQEYAKKIWRTLMDVGIRAELDDRKEPLSAKIRDAQTEKASYMLILGDTEMENSTVSIRARSGTPTGPKPIEEFIHDIMKEIHERSIDENKVQTK